MLKEILKEIKPSKEETKEANEIVRDVLKTINKVSKGKAIVGGSGAKETWLSGTKEIDVFVKYPMKLKGKDISKILEKELKKKFKISKLHGSRDYFQINYKGFVFEIIPVLNIKNPKDAVNITDVSPFHALWVKKHKKYSDDIRLIKQFAKAQKVYGAESYLRGFSGYVLEILIIYYKGFNNLIIKASKWKSKVVIDPNKLLKNPLNELNKSKLVSPLVIVDPVDKTRNAAASLNDESFDTFVKACKNFLKKPSKSLFKIKEEKIPEDSIKLKLDIKGKIDVVGAKILKLFEFISYKLKKEGYKFTGGWNLTGVIWFKVSNKRLSSTKVVRGPPLKLKEAVKNFKKKHKKISMRNGKIYAKIKRKYPFVVDFLKDLINNKEVKDRVKNIDISK